MRLKILFIIYVIRYLKIHEYFLSSNWDLIIYNNSDSVLCMTKQTI